mmetsp:Transcript_12010/g.14938  ORF Transcript_12010/g.14938 Transcript_12010/m.14938 type:complete len:173 (-) Transcript_12010:1442-1960(-)
MFRRIIVSSVKSSSSSSSSRGIPRGCSSLTRGVEEFWSRGESYTAGQKRIQTGRSWEAKELRRKSFEDLHKLWYVCLKERNMLETERLASRAAHQKWEKPGRLVKVRKTMARIKTIVNERSREYQEIRMEKKIKKQDAWAVKKKQQQKQIDTGSGSEKEKGTCLLGETVLKS